MRQVKVGSSILERTRSALVREVSNGARVMRLMGVWLSEMTEPIHDIRCVMRVSEVPADTLGQVCLPAERVCHAPES